jgi:hypothetical protein
VLIEEAVNARIIFFGFTQLELESTIYLNRGEHDNDYTTVAVYEIISNSS